MPRLHDGQIELPDELVRELVDRQFPQWSALPLRRIGSAGTIHRVDRLGEELVVRMPFIDWAVEDVPLDAKRLPRLAAALPVDVPELLGEGQPAPGMPWRWGVYRWLEGTHPVPGDDDAALGRQLADAVIALRSMPPVGNASPVPFRPADDAASRPKVQALGSPAALAAWDAGASLEREPAAASGWIHGDLMPGNLLMRAGRLTGIIDWGASGVGDPSFDLLAAWTCLGPEGRGTYLAALGCTPAQIALARAYAVKKVAWGLPYYRESLPGFAAALAHTLAQIEHDAA